MLWVYLTELVLSVILVAWQYAWPPWLRLSGQAPDLAVVLLVTVGLTRSPLEGCWSGLVTGLMVGSLGRLPLGGLFVSHIGGGTALGLLGGRIFPNYVPVAMLVTAIAVVAMSVVEMLFLPPPYFVRWVAETFSQAIISGLVAAPLFALLRALFSYLPAAER